MSSIYDKSSLVLIPSGTKTGKVFSQKPVSGDGDFTFTRASAATRVNADGNIEKETQNLLYQSNNFSSGFWTTSSSSVTGGQSGYDGSSDAWLLSKSGASGRLFQNLSASGVLTFSVYMKANASTWGLIQVDGSPNDAYAYVDLSNGIFGSTSSNNIIENIENVGSGWYRVSLSVNDNVTRVRVYPAETNSASGTSGSIYIQDAQLEQGLVARDYIETTTAAVYGGITDNTPRLDYTDSSCPALLLEPQRTNLVVQSEYPSSNTSSGYVYVRGGATATYNYGISPEGVQNSTLISGSTGNNGVQVNFTSSAVNQDWSYSFYIKGTLGETINLRFEISPYASQSQEYITFTGEWQRIERTISYNATAHTGKHLYITFLSASTATQFEIYGLQAEANASYATSYIPTYGSSVSLSQDEAIPPSTSYDLSGSFSIFFSFGKTRKKAASGSTYFYWLNTNANDFMLYTNAGGNQGLNVYLPNQGGYVFGSSSNAAWNSNESKICVTYDATTGRLAYFINGSKYNEQTSVLSFTGDDVGSFIEGGATNLAEIKKYMFFTQALSDEEVIDLTTL